jgi:hypothetical protein
MRRTLAAASTTIIAFTLAACGSSTSPDAAPTSSAPELPVATPSDDPSPSPTESLSVEAASGQPQWGEPIEVDGLVYTVQEPEFDDTTDWEGTIDTELFPVEAIFTITVTNKTDAPVNLAAMDSAPGYDVVSGTYEGDYLMCESDLTAPSRLQPGRTAEWPECFAIADADDIVFTIYTPNDGRTLDYFLGGPSDDTSEKASTGDAEADYVARVQEAGKPILHEFPDAAATLEDTETIVEQGAEVCSMIGDGMTLDEIYMQADSEAGVPLEEDPNFMFANFLWATILEAPDTICPEHADVVDEWKAAAH